MKPSERIAAIAAEQLRLRVPGEPTLEVMQFAQVHAITLYLDEQHERAQRVEHLRNAITLTRPFVAAKVVNELLGKAGLSTRVYEHDEIDCALASIVDEAKREGLL
jgi:hypothetical protein